MKKVIVPLATSLCIVVLSVSQVKSQEITSPPTYTPGYTIITQDYLGNKASYKFKGEIRGANDRIFYEWEGSYRDVPTKLATTQYLNYTYIEGFGGKTIFGGLEGYGRLNFPLIPNTTQKQYTYLQNRNDNKTSRIRQNKIHDWEMIEIGGKKYKALKITSTNLDTSKSPQSNPDEETYWYSEELKWIIKIEIVSYISRQWRKIYYEEIVEYKNE